jgi:hypothetical protein
MEAWPVAGYEELGFMEPLGLACQAKGNSSAHEKKKKLKVTVPFSASIHNVQFPQKKEKK